MWWELSNIIILVKTAFWSTVHSLSRAHSYPFSPSRDTSLGGSRTQLSLGEEESLEISTEESETKKRVDKKVDKEKEEWGVVLESPSLPEESKTDSLMTLQRWGFTQENTTVCLNMFLLVPRSKELVTCEKQFKEYRPQLQEWNSM